MSTATLPPLPAPASTPPPRAARPAPLVPHRFTIDEYRKLALTGLFNDVKTMLLHGELYVMTMPNPPHDFALSATYEYLRSICPPGHYVRNQQGFDVGTRHDPGPDLALVVGSMRDYVSVTPTTAALVVEVSGDSLTTDLTTKAELYATAGVPEYWILDLANRELIVLRDPQPLPAGLGATAYRSHATHRATDSVASLLAPSSPVAVGDLLP